MRRLKRSDPLFAVAAQRHDGRCEAATGAWGDPTAKPCTNKLDEVWLLDDSTVVALCRHCRIMGAGLTPGEKAARTKRNKAKQEPMFGQEWLKKTETE